MKHFRFPISIVQIALMDTAKLLMAKDSSFVKCSRTAIERFFKIRERYEQSLGDKSLRTYETERFQAFHVPKPLISVCPENPLFSAFFDATVSS